MTRLGDVAEIRSEKVQPSDAQDSTYIGLEHIQQQTLALSGVGSGADVSSQKQRFYRGDVLFGKLRPYFRKVILAQEEGICSTDIWVVRPKDEADSAFILYLLASEKFIEEATNTSEGSRMPRANWRVMSDYEFPDFTAHERAKMGQLLSLFDEKIGENRHASALLEKTSQSLFKSWFIDFDPVKAKMAGETPVGMDAETAAFFPDSMDDSELGEIPSGWRVSNVGSLVQLAGGATPSTKNPEFWDGEYSWLTPKDLSGRRQKIAPPPSRKITLRGLERISSGLLEKGTVLLSSRAPIGYTAICATETAVNQGFIALKADELFPPMYLLNWVEANMQEILNRAGGATFSEVSKAAFRDIPFLCPDAGILHRYREVTAPIVSQLEVLEAESRSLAELRDTLLPRLISGELEIPEEMLAA